MTTTVEGIERTRDWLHRLQVLAAFVGLVGIGIGLWMLLHGVAAGCVTGSHSDASGRCYAHPNAGVGIALIVVCLLLGIVVAIASMILTAVLDERFARAMETSPSTD